MDRLTLYRGDAQKIKEFDFHKTHKSCLYGQGIYLTNNLQTATTYRSKGVYENKEEFYSFYGEAKDRLDALNKAFEQNWNSIRYRSYVRKMKEKDREKFKAERRRDFERKVEERLITAEYVSKNMGKALLEVFDCAEKQIGFISEFSFDKKSFEASMIKIDQHYDDVLFWEIVWEKKIPFGAWSPDNKSDFIRHNCVNLSLSGSYLKLRGIEYARKDDIARRLRTACEPYGYRGIEYAGGAYTGSARHRAFVVWDDDFVNDHFVRRFK
jgi:hypothetical protein